MSRRTTAERGYGRAHGIERARWKRVVAAGGALCARCGLPIAPDEPWDLDHADDREAYLGVSHRYCNRAAGGRRGRIGAGRRSIAEDRAWSRDWF